MIMHSDPGPARWPDDLREAAALLWPDDPFPESVVACELIDALAHVGAYDLKPSDPPF